MLEETLARARIAFSDASALARAYTDQIQQLVISRAISGLGIE